MKQKKINQNLLLKLCMVFLIIQPILDIYILFEPQVISFFHFSPSTIIRIIFVGILLLLLLFTIKWEKKYIWIFIYLALILIYTILHHQNALHFQSKVEGNFSYSIVSELFYIIRMLLPLTLVFISSHLKFNKKQIETVISWLVILISGSIIVTNLLEISLNSYTNLKITGSIFDWFGKEPLSYRLGASKGFFMYANQIAALELLLTPLVFYFTIKNPNRKNICLIFMQLFAMFMLGTKVAALGFMILLVCMLVMYFFFGIIKKEIRISKKTILIFLCLCICCLVLLPKSPMENRSSVTEQISEEHHHKKICKEIKFNFSDPYTYHVTEKNIKVNWKEKCESEVDIENKKMQVVENSLNNLKTEEEKENYLVSFLKKEYGNFALEKTFIKNSYPYQYDASFWYQEMKRPMSERVNYRILEEDMLKRVKEINNNPKDELYGITYSRMSNIFNLERDFLSHYYSLGWIGLILLLFPYLILLGICIVKILIHFKEKFTFYNCTLALALGITFFSAFYSGNVMDGLVVSLILGFVLGQLLRSTFEKTTKSGRKKVSVIMPTYNDSETILLSLDSLMKQSYKNWELVIVDDGSTDDTKKIIEEFMKKCDIEKRIQYIYQENTDQLKAIIHGLDYITGDYVFILHSDDLLATNDTFEKAVFYMEQNHQLDAIIAPLLIIDDNGKLTGRQEVLNYSKNKKIPAIQMLWLGRNLYVDVGFFKKECYVTKIKETYLTWNMPFWLHFDKKVKTLNVETVDFELLRYRVHSSNYINNELGKLNVINGELRTLTTLMKYYDIPNYQKQYTIFRIFSKLHLLNIYKPKYSCKESENKENIVEFVIQKRFGEDYKNNIYLDSLVSFYKQKNKRKITFSDIYRDEDIYLGNEMRKFNKQLLENKLPKFYKQILKEMKKGFDEIIVQNETEFERACAITKFLCIESEVKITKK